MSKPVKTFDCAGGVPYCYGCYHMEEDKDGWGDYVLKTDYDLLAALRSQVAELQRQLDEAAKQEPFGWFCDWGNDDVAMYYDGPGNALTDDWNSYPAMAHNIPLYAHPINLPVIIEQERKAEREECAKVCDGYAAQSVPRITASMADLCAAAIRARNQTTRPVSASSK